MAGERFTHLILVDCAKLPSVGFEPDVLYNSVCFSAGSLTQRVLRFGVLAVDKVKDDPGGFFEVAFIDSLH